MKFSNRVGGGKNIFTEIFYMKIYRVGQSFTADFSAYFLPFIWSMTPLEIKIGPTVLKPTIKLSE